jgi:hypothetical protein
MFVQCKPDAAGSRGRRADQNRMRRVLALLAAVLIPALLAQGAFANRRDDPFAHRGHSHFDQRVTKILSRIAAHQVHGLSGDAIPISELESDLAAGQRIVVSCGTVAQIGVDAARQAGYEARRVGAFTRQRLNHYDDGHVLMEVRLREGWTVFDLDNNRMAPPGVGITELVRDPRWRLIAHDEPYDKAETAAGPHPNYDRAMFRHLDRWYRRVLGVPTIFGDDNTIWFHNRQERARGEALGYQWASGSYWRQLKR